MLREYREKILDENPNRDETTAILNRLSDWYWYELLQQKGENVVRENWNKLIKGDWKSYHNPEPRNQSQNQSQDQSLSAEIVGSDSKVEYCGEDNKEVDKHK